jgi:hypothetical protein
LYLLAMAAGEVRMLSDVPRTLWRQHGSNVTTAILGRNRKFISSIVSKWRWQKVMRRGLSRQAQGFVLASATLPPGPKLERLLALAPLVATIDSRQSPVALTRLWLRRALRPSWHKTFWLVTSCLWSTAKPPTVTPQLQAQDDEPSATPSEA